MARCNFVEFEGYLEFRKVGGGGSGGREAAMFRRYGGGEGHVWMKSF